MFYTPTANDAYVLVLVDRLATEEAVMNRDMLPMLAGKAHQEVPDYPVNEWAEPKLDGWRTIVHIENGSVHLYGGRNGSDYTGRVPYIEQALSIVPKDSVLDGELVSSTDWGMVQSIMTTQQTHVPSAHSPALTFYVFDILRLDGHDIRTFPWKDRRRLVDRIARGEYVRPTPLVPAKQYILEEVVKMGFEGLVIKDPESRYVNKRSNAWEKIKPQLTTEARIIGFKPGEGSFKGLIGAIEFELLDSGVKSRCSGFNMALRAEITIHQHEWLGRIIEIKHHGLSKDGVPRHPQFSRVRDDL